MPGGGLWTPPAGTATGWSAWWIPTAEGPGGVRRGRVPTTGISVTGEGVGSNPLWTLPGRPPPPAAIPIRSVAVPAGRPSPRAWNRTDPSHDRDGGDPAGADRSCRCRGRRPPHGPHASGLDAATTAGRRRVGRAAGSRLPPFNRSMGGRHRRRRGHSVMQPSSASRRDRRNPTRPLAGRRGVARRYRRLKGSCPPSSRLAVPDVGMSGVTATTLPHPGPRHLRGPVLGLMVQGSRSRRGAGGGIGGDSAPRI
jgi:hypothetical protein